MSLCFNFRAFSSLFANMLMAFVLSLMSAGPEFDLLFAVS